MTAASFHARTGEIIGTLGFTQAMSTPFVNNVYTGDPDGIYFSNVDFWDAVASMRLGLTVREFRAWPLNLRKLYRDKAERDYGSITGGSSATFTAVLNLVSSGSFASKVHSQQHASTHGLTTNGANPSAELLIGFIPEWGNGTSQANIDAKNLAVKKMGWSHDKTVEFAKSVRRERSISIRGVFDKIIQLRNSGYSVTQTARKVI